MTGIVIAILFFLLLSAFFSGSEIAFISANKLGVEVEKGKGTRRGAILARFYEKPKDFLGVMLVGNNIALVVFTYLMTSLIRPYLESYVQNEGFLLLVITIMITVVVLLFGEFLPKTLFRLYANEMINFLAFPLVFFRFLLQLPAWIMIGASNFILRYVFRVPSDPAQDAITRLDLQDFVEGTLSEDQDEIEADMFKNALNLKKVKVKDCMVPRTEIVSVDVHDNINTLIKKFKQSGHSRILVIDEDVDNVLGYVHHQELLKSPKNTRKALREMPFLPEAMNVNDLMFKFMYEDINIACVVDEFGGTAGIITLEDILEEIFGEIEDEHDVEQFTEQKISESEFLFSGRLEIDYLNEKYEALDFEEGEYHTLSGYIVMTNGIIPEQGAELEMHGYKFIFESVSDTKIEEVRVIKLDPAIP